MISLRQALALWLPVHTIRENKVDVLSRGGQDLTCDVGTFSDADRASRERNVTAEGKAIPVSLRHGDLSEADLVGGVVGNNSSGDVAWETHVCEYALASLCKDATEVLWL